MHRQYFIYNSAQTGLKEKQDNDEIMIQIGHLGWNHGTHIMMQIGHLQYRKKTQLVLNFNS